MIEDAGNISMLDSLFYISKLATDASIYRQRNRIDSLIK